MINVLVLTDTNILEENFVFTGKDAESRAERKFLNLCENYISNWDEYSSNDIDNVLDQGYESFGNGYVIISHPVLNPDITVAYCTPD